MIAKINKMNKKMNMYVLNIYKNTANIKNKEKKQKDSWLKIRRGKYYIL